LVNSFGSVTMAAYTAASRMDSFAMMPIQNFGMAISTYTGQNVGANRLDRVSHGLKSALMMVAISCLIVSALVFTMGPQLIEIFINASETEVISRGVDYMKTVSLFYIVFGVIMIFNGVLRGAGDTVIPMYTTIANLIVRVAAAYYLVRIPSLSYRGIWWAIPAGWIVGSIVPVVRYYTGGWKAKAVIRQQMFAQKAEPEPELMP
ncbi:MAG: MATE family efflux transporter, partial [Bacillota bacterium]